MIAEDVKQGRSRGAQDVHLRAENGAFQQQRSTAFEGRSFSLILYQQLSEQVGEELWRPAERGK